MMLTAQPSRPFSCSIICPCHNEAEGVAAFLAEVEKALQPLTPDYEILFIDDGSTDNTLQCLTALAIANRHVRVLELSRNFGKEAALTCGLDHAQGDVVIPIDADLQDPPSLIPALIAQWHQGFEVVLARRNDRTSDHWAKRTSANWFYRFHNVVSVPKIPENVGDFRLMDRQVVAAIRRLPEHRRFMKGLFAWVGFRTTTIDYVRAERHAGTTKFNAWQLWNFALEGITSFSTAPLRFWTYFGGTVAASAFLIGIYLIVRTLLYGVDVPGYASLFVSILFLGGLQLIGLGVLGEYIGRIYQESKARPVYIVRREWPTSPSEDPAP